MLRILLSIIWCCCFFVIEFKEVIMSCCKLICFNFLCVVFVIKVFIGLLLIICNILFKVLYKKWFNCVLLFMLDSYFFVFFVGLFFLISFLIVVVWKNLFLIKRDKLLVIVCLLLVIILVWGMGYLVGIGLNKVVIVN